MADVSSNMYQWSTIAASNNPQGATTIGTGLDDNLREIQAVARTEYNKHVLAHIPCGRLTLTSGTAITTSDVTAAETLYYTPFNGNTIVLFDGTNWRQYAFSELSIDVPDATSMYDVFVYDNAGTVTLELTAWTNDTTRATALTTQNGVLVKTGALTRRYVGSFYATTAGNGQTEDSLTKRYVWNYYNRVRRPMKVKEGTNSWAYSTQSFQQANASTANQLAMVRGLNEDAVDAQVTAAVSTDQAAARAVYVGIGLDSTSALAGDCVNGLQQVTSTAAVSLNASYRGLPGLGLHTLVWLEAGGGADTQTWFGDNGGSLVNTGLVATVMA